MMNELPLFVIVALVSILKEDTILLAKQSYGNQHWSLPGGVVEFGESVDQAAIREVKEETGLDIRVKRVVGLYSKPDEKPLAITIEGEINGGILVSNNEVCDCQYFHFDDLFKTREHLYQRADDFVERFQMLLFEHNELCLIQVVACIQGQWLH
jgi:8-oxo-dGTP pyrophosphatase MutT (NUDIX family)